MNVLEETNKRLKIIDDFKGSISDLVDCIEVGGSMAVGQNYSVRPDSDIDMIVVAQKEGVRKLANSRFFSDKTGENVLATFEQGKIDMFWITNSINGVQVNSFIYDANSFRDFCLLRKDLRIYIGEKVSPTHSGAIHFDGAEATYQRKIEKFGAGFIYDRRALIDGKYIGSVPRNDFFFMNYLVFDRNNFFAGLSDEVWRTVAEKLVNEHGPKVDLSKYSILNTLFAYQKKRDKVSKEIFERIDKRTRQELASLL